MRRAPLPSLAFRGARIAAVTIAAGYAAVAVVDAELNALIAAYLATGIDRLLLGVVMALARSLPPRRAFPAAVRIRYDVVGFGTFPGHGIVSSLQISSVYRTYCHSRVKYDLVRYAERV